LNNLPEAWEQMKFDNSERIKLVYSQIGRYELLAVNEFRLPQIAAATLTVICGQDEAFIFNS